MTAKDILKKLSEMDVQFDAIKNDNNLTDIGKQKQLDNLRESYNAYHDTAAKELEKSWSELKSKIAENKRKTREAHQAESDSWSYDKLRYYREVAGDKLRRAYSLDEAEKLINTAVDYGSREEQRAYLESTDAIQVRFASQTGSGALISSMNKRAAELSRPPELDKLEPEEQQLKRDAFTLYDDTRKVLDKYPSRAMSSPITSLIRDVDIKVKVREAGDLEYTVKFADDEP